MHAKGFLDSNFNEAVIDKNQISRNCPRFYILNNIAVFKSIIGKKVDHLLLPYKYYGRNM